MNLIIIYLLSHTITAIAGATVLREVPSKQGPAEFNSEVLASYISSDEDSFISGFNADPKFKSSRLQLTYFAQKSDAFTGKFLLGNYTSKVMDFQIVCLIDYKQCDFNLDGKWSKTHDVKLLPKKNSIFSIELKVLKEGVHDFMIVAVRKDIDQFKEYSLTNSLDIQYGVLSHRANIFVSKGDFPKIEFKKLNSSSSIINDKKYSQITINNKQKTSNFGALRKDKMPKIGKINYSVHVSNYSEKEISSALVLFSNGEQISFDTDGKKSPTYFYTQKKMSANVIPVQMDINKKINNMWALSIDNPYALLETEYGVIATIPSSIRITNIIIFE